jgi:hypothetical protein
VIPVFARSTAELETVAAPVNEAEDEGLKMSVPAVTATADNSRGVAAGLLHHFLPDFVRQSVLHHIIKSVQTERGKGQKHWPERYLLSNAFLKALQSQTTEHETPVL